MPVVTCWPSCARTARSSAASTSPSTKRPRPESSIRRLQTSRASRSREGRSSAFKRPTPERSSSSAAECPSFWTEPLSVRSEQVPARLNKTSRWQKRLSLHSVIHHVERKGYMARTQESGKAAVLEDAPVAKTKGYMRAARMHEYGKAPILEEIPIPDIQPDEILVNVKACGMCRSDVLLIDGFFRPYADVPPPITLGHEVTGVVSKIGSNVPKASGFNEGDHVVVDPGWGDGTCRYCQIGNTHLCPNVRWPGFGPAGGFAEFIPVPARYLIKVDNRLKFEELAPLTDAGLTPYRGIKKLRDAGALAPDRVLGVFGIGGLGAYAVQYAKLLGSGAKVVAFARNPDKLAVAKRYGADHIINIKGKSPADIGQELRDGTGQRDIDAIIDCTGASEVVQLAFTLLSISGHYVDVGLVGDRLDVPLFPRVSREQTFHGSFWGSYTDLSEVMALAAQGKIRHTVKTITFDQINEPIDLLRSGEIVGRAVIKY